LSQMDVPARQAFIAALVEPGERTAAAAYTNTARYAGRPAGPTVAGALMQHTALAAPFVAAGIIKSLYDLVIYAGFRARRAPGPGDHPGVAAEVHGAVAGAHPGAVGVLAHDVLDPADLAGPRLVLPGPAHRGHVGDPGELGVERGQLGGIAQLLGAAGALQGD